MENRFAAFAGKGSAQPKKKKQQQTASADAAADQRGGSGLGKGFRVVEEKPNKRTKPKAPKQPQQDQQQGQDKPAAPRWIGCPVGGTVVDPEDIKREKKAAASLRKHYAKQVKTVVTHDDGEERRHGAKGKVDDSVEVSTTATGSKVLMLKGAPAPEESGAEEAPVATATSGSSKKKGAAWNTQPSKHADPTSTSAAPTAGPKKTSGGGGKSKKGGGASSGPKPTPQPIEKAKAVDHTHLDDGSVIPQVLLTFYGADGKTKLQAQSKACAEKMAVAIAEHVVQSKPLKVGLFISSEAHEFSNALTIDEPWMMDSMYKAMAALLRGDKKEAKAYPYWHPAQGKHEAVEGELTLSLFGDSALTLQHDNKARIGVKTLRVHRAEFLKASLMEGKKLVAIIKATEKELGKAPNVDEKKLSKWMLKFPPVDHLEEHLNVIESHLAQS